MEAFRPLSARGNADPRFDTLHEGLPTWMRPAALHWIEQFFRPPDGHLAVARLENVLRVDPPLDWQVPDDAWPLLVARVTLDEELALDVLDYLLRHYSMGAPANDLNEILISGGSAWEVTEQGDRYQLTRRAVGPMIETIDAIRTHSQRAHHHLTAAWSALMGRDPNPSAAYREAIRAVEAAARPIVTPNDTSATLGKIIRSIRDKPTKWTTVLDQSSPEQVADMANLVWKGQVDRHGTDDPNAPLAVTQEEADAAFHIALALVRLFASGAIKPAP